METVSKESLKSILDPYLQPDTNSAEVRKAVNEICAEVVRLKVHRVPGTGHWIDMFGMYRCSNCNHTEAKKRNFCEDCGSDMRGEQ